MKSHCEHGVRNCKKKDENQYLQTHREIFCEDLLHFCSKPAALCNGLLCLLFFLFINSDVDHYHILLSVVITADKRDEPETSMDASNTWLYGVPNQFSVVWPYLEQNEINLWETKCSREWNCKKQKRKIRLVRTADEVPGRILRRMWHIKVQIPELLLSALDCVSSVWFSAQTQHDQSHNSLNIC